MSITCSNCTGKQGQALQHANLQDAMSCSQTGSPTARKLCALLQLRQPNRQQDERPAQRPSRHPHSRLSPTYMVLKPAAALKPIVSRIPTLPMQQCACCQRQLSCRSSPGTNRAPKG